MGACRAFGAFRADVDAEVYGRCGAVPACARALPAATSRILRDPSHPARRLRRGKRMSIELIGYLAALLTTAAFVPQALKTLRSRDTRGISGGMYAIFAGGTALWFLYGLLLGSIPIMLANGATFALAGAILGLKLRYG
jgi:MtN3 and saliva related transmembrane protein